LVGRQALGVKTQAPLTQVSSVQRRLSLQTIGVFTQTGPRGPSAQESVVHALLSSQEMGVFEQDPVAGSQLSAVQNNPSLHDFGVYTHDPVAGLQLSEVHALLSLQVTPAQRLGADPPQIPRLVREMYGQHAPFIVQVATVTPAGMK